MILLLMMMTMMMMVVMKIRDRVLGSIPTSVIGGLVHMTITGDIEVIAGRIGNA